MTSLQEPMTESSSSEQTSPTKSTSLSTTPMLALPAPETRSADDPIRLNVTTGESYSLYERLGPTIVASDGSEYPHQPRVFVWVRFGLAKYGLCFAALSRIGNWAEMDELERSRVLRVLGKRNQIRLEAKRNEQELEQYQRRTEAGATDEGDNHGRPAP
ncbi:BQ5605_C021g09375 [Microbotryum silenes-dioicae]|uniref:BQ5605_C021g09375 protein n=1 Tax=Microbotryum silenes-dioicae TaxID=796604 RepID=A0A2X0PL07_9BASI|nr:BQ5605_C021g09375 [Microbotryum silenes-dioicae]